jgi:Reverse transcriptase (RNA-dependent DNA polymerase)
VYLDDVIVFSSCRKAHLAHVAEVLNVLGNAGLLLKFQKCRFFAEAVKYLGHVICPGRLGIAEKNTEALKVAPLPRTQVELRSFLGLCKVYRRFVPLFSAIAAPLNALLCKGMPSNLGCLPPEAIAVFETLRDRLLSPPVLALPARSGRCGWTLTPRTANLAVAYYNDNPMIRPSHWGIGPVLCHRPITTTRPPRRSAWPLFGRSLIYDPT